MKTFPTIAAAAAVLEVKPNTLSKQLKREGGSLQMLDMSDKEVMVKRNAKTGEVTISEVVTVITPEVEVKPAKKVKKAKRKEFVLPGHHVHTNKSDMRMSRMKGVEVESEKRVPGIYVTVKDDTAVFNNNALAAAFAGCTVSRLSEVRRAAKVRQLADNGSFTVTLKNGATISMVRVNECVMTLKQA